jgi:hypothetical protein
MKVFRLGLAEAHHLVFYFGRPSFLGGLLGGGSKLGTFFASGSDAFEQLTGRFVIWVLRDELPGKGVAENGLVQRLSVLQLRFQIGVEMVDDGQLVFDPLRVPTAKDIYSQ